MHSLTLEHHSASKVQTILRMLVPGTHQKCLRLHGLWTLEGRRRRSRWRKRVRKRRHLLTYLTGIMEELEVVPQPADTLTTKSNRTLPPAQAGHVTVQKQITVAQ